MSPDDVIHRFRLRVFALANELGNVRAACRQMGIHPSTYYRWASNVETWGLEALRPRERRRPRMPNQLPEWVEHRILAFSLAHPGLGPKRISAELARVRWGSLRVSPNGVWRCLSRHGLGHRRARLSLVAGYAAPPEPGHEPEPERHLDAPHPGALVGMDCFYVGRLSGTKGVCWQYTAIDVHSGFTWAELHTTDKNPAARLCSALARRVAHDLAAVGWRLEVVTTDIQPESAPQVLGSLGRRHEDREDRRPSTVVDDRSERTARLLAC